LINGGLPTSRKEDGSDLKVLKIGQQALEIDFSSGAQQGGIVEHKEMMGRMHDLPVARHIRYCRWRARPLIIERRNSAKPTWY
jgi:hypothetical protein